MKIDVKLPTAIDHLLKALPALQNLVNFDNSKPAKEKLVFRLLFGGDEEFRDARE